MHRLAGGQVLRSGTSGSFTISCPRVDSSPSCPEAASVSQGERASLTPRTSHRVREGVREGRAR